MSKTLASIHCQFKGHRPGNEHLISIMFCHKTHDGFTVITSWDQSWALPLYYLTHLFAICHPTSYMPTTFRLTPNAFPPLHNRCRCEKSCLLIIINIFQIWAPHILQMGSHVGHIDVQCCHVHIISSPCDIAVGEVIAIQVAKVTYLLDVTLRSAKKENRVVSSCCGCNGSQPNPWKLLQWKRVKGNGSNQRTILLCFSTVAGVQILSLQIRTRDQATDRR